MMKESRVSTVTAYLLATLGIVLAFSAQGLLRPWLGNVQLILVYPTIYLICWFLGLGPSLWAIFLGACTAIYLFMPPLPVFLSGFSEDQYRILTFFISSTFITWLVARGRQLEAIKREGDRQFRLLADTMAQLVWVTDLDGQVEYINQRWFAYTGQRKKVITREDWLEATHPEDRERVFKAHQDALLKRQEFNVEYRLRRWDGEYRWFLARTVFVPDAQGQIMKRFGTATDIHDQYMLMKDLREAVRTRDEFLSIASHELKTPLTSLQLHIQLRQRYLKKKNLSLFSPDKIEQDLEEQLRFVQRISRLVEDMLDVSRISSGKMVFNNERFDLKEMVSQVCEQFKPTAEASGVQLDVTTEGKIEGKWDRFRLEQVLFNLLTNALRYGQNRPIHVELKRESDRARLLVQDEGIGIAKEDQKRIFNRFERAISLYQGGGMGLGLYISREIVRAHGGSIEVESELNQGSKFIVNLPIEKGVEHPL